MSRYAQVEELSDSDPDEMDIDDFDDDTPIPSNAIITPRASAAARIPPNSSSSTSTSTAGYAQPGALPFTAPTHSSQDQQHRERSKHWQCLYPVYFDASRSREQGRRVAKSLAVHNPLARDIADAVARLGVSVVFEPGRIHPKDWANPGRVRCLVKEEGEMVAMGVKNKHHLYIKIAEYLQQNPTTASSPLKLKIPGLPPTTEPLPPPAVPKGWKVGSILPLHSAAVTGGGVSDNLFKDMMAGMQGQLPPGMEGMAQLAGGSGAGGGGKSKKEKKKFIRA